MHLSMSSSTPSLWHSGDLTKLGVKGPSIGAIINLVKSSLYPHPLTGTPHLPIWDLTTCRCILIHVTIVRVRVLTHAFNVAYGKQHRNLIHKVAIWRLWKQDVTVPMQGWGDNRCQIPYKL